MTESLWQSIITGGFTLMAAFMGSFLLEWKSRHQRKTSVRSAILSEMESMVDVAEMRGYRLFFQEGADGDANSVEIAVPDTYRSVFNGNISNLGLLDPNEVRTIVRFYQSIGGIVQDVRPGGPLADGRATPESFQESLAIYDMAMNDARRLLGREERHE